MLTMSDSVLCDEVIFVNQNAYKHSEFLITTLLTLQQLGLTANFPHLIGPPVSSYHHSITSDCTCPLCVYASSQSQNGK